MMNFIRRVYSECTEVITTSLIPLGTILHAECAFIIGLALLCGIKCRIADGTLADAILIPPCPPILPTNIRKVRVCRIFFAN